MPPNRGPDAPGRYLAGVECDGATYHRSATARDRLRENVLTRLGWKIRRVWSTEWWQHANRAIAKLHDRLIADLDADRLAAAEAAEAAARDMELALAATVAAAVSTEPAKASHEAEPSGVADEPSRLIDKPNSTATAMEKPENDGTPLAALTSSTSILMAAEPERLYAYAVTPALGVSSVAHASYRIADPGASGFSPDPELFYDPLHRRRIRAMVSHVIDIEGPIYEDVLVQRIARAHGFSRAAGRIREVVLDATDKQHPKTVDDGCTLFWPRGADVSMLVAFRAAPGDIRDHSDVPLIELGTLGQSFLTQRS